MSYKAPDDESVNRDPTRDANGRKLSAGDIKEAAILLRASESQVDLHATLEQSMEQQKLARHLPPVQLRLGFGPVPADNEKVFFFDIDNCLYKQSTKIHDLMQIYIHRYFKQHLHLNDADAHALHMKYYKEYGLAIEGLVREHRINALDYNKVVDDALPLDQILRPNAELRKFLLRLKMARQVGRLWLFTNAYKNHALRVIHLLGLGDVFDGMTFCDYSSQPMLCKPLKESFDRALHDAGVTDPANAYYIDDSQLNVNAAAKFGWKHVIRYVEMSEGSDEEPDLSGLDPSVEVVHDVKDIGKVYPELMKGKY